MKIIDITTEYRKNPIGVDAEKPRFTWVMQSGKNNVKQLAYRLCVKQNGDLVWDSGQVKSEESVLVEYGGPRLIPATKYDCFLKIWNNQNEESQASFLFETGLMDYTSMQADWITHPYQDDFEPCPVFLYNFNALKQVESARLYVTALGIYEAKLNGQKIGDAFLAPGWTSYKHRLQVQTYDITQLIDKDNKLEITLANGWYKGILGFQNTPDHYGNRTALLAQIGITYTDGTKETHISSPDWMVTTGYNQYAELYNGQVIDMAAKPLKQEPATHYDYPKNMLVGQESEPVRTVMRLLPEKKIITPNGEVVLDFGQNLVGIVEAKLCCTRGTRVVLRHAETLDKEGNFYTDNLREAKATDTFICSGGEDVFAPSFTFHGFRYVQIDGLGEDIDKASFTACVLHTDMAPIGKFSCSNKDVSQLQSNIQWGQRGNFLDIPTDCPQRDERLGWTGDAQVFAATAAFNFNTALFFTKWLRDLAAEQTESYGVPHTIPNILGTMEGAAAWSDAATIVPWAVYMAYGDKRLLEQQYSSMKGWVEFIRARAGEAHLWQSGYQYGDWLALDREENEGRTGATDVYLISSAYYALSVGIVSKAAKVLGYDAEAKEYGKLEKQIINAFQKEYITETGRMVSETQTGCALALHFSLAQDKHKKRISNSLANNIANHNNHLSTGFVGTPYLCHALSDNGLHDLAGTLFLKRDYPSWLYAVDMGATTIWERWNSVREDGSLGEAGMNSLNHYAYGSIGDWMYQKIGGLNIIEPGYKKIKISPMPIKGITWADASIITPYGVLSCYWKCDKHVFTADIVVPANTSAIIQLPGQEEQTVGSGTYHFECDTNLELEPEQYSMDTTLKEVLEHPAAIVFLKQQANELFENPLISVVADRSLSDFSATSPEIVPLLKAAVKLMNDAENN